MIEARGGASLAALLCAAALGCSSADRPQPPGLEAGAGRPPPSAAVAPPTTAPGSAAPQEEAAAPTASAAPSAASPAASADAPAPAGAPEPAASSAPRPGDGPYARFFAALRDLEQGKRRDHVRVAWLGDSHTAADFWSGALRTVLQKRFGYAGPGFVHLGFEAYRHDGVKAAVEGKWRMRPKGPSTMTVTGDGVFGLGGILFIPDGGGARAQLSLTEPAFSGRARWDVCYRLSAPHDQLTVSLTGAEPAVVKATPESPPGAIRHLSLLGDAGATLTVSPSGGAPELCGAVIEGDPAVRPGVVVDTLGINGARLGTPLAWSEPSWAAELARRAPSLAVIAYGTNESGDFNADPSTYGRQLTEVLARIRRVQPEVDCLALAPTDRRDTPDRTPLVRDALREAARANGCGFWDTYEAMGGKGSIDAWANEKPPRAARDGVHLTSRGYREIGFKLADEVLKGYRP